MDDLIKFEMMQNFGRQGVSINLSWGNDERIECYAERDRFSSFMIFHIDRKLLMKACNKSEKQLSLKFIDNGNALSSCDC